MRRVLGGVTALVAVVSLAGCGGDDDTGGLPPLSESSSTPSQTVTTAPESPTTPPSTPITGGITSPTAGPASKVVAVHRRNVVATTAEQKAVADAFLQFTVVRLLAMNRAAVDIDALGKVASGRALAQVKSAVVELQGKKLHTIGELWVDIPAVTVKGATATVQSCMDNTTVDVDKAGKPVEMPSPYYIATGTLQKAGGQVWVVENLVVQRQRCR